jgi:hypothetical protein
MAGQRGVEIVQLFRREAHRQRLPSLFFDHAEEFAALARDLDAVADRIERETRRCVLLTSTARLQGRAAPS